MGVLFSWPLDAVTKLSPFSPSLPPIGMQTMKELMQYVVLDVVASVEKPAGNRI